MNETMIFGDQAEQSEAAVSQFRQETEEDEAPIPMTISPQPHQKLQTQIPHYIETGGNTNSRKPTETEDHVETDGEVVDDDQDDDLASEYRDKFLETPPKEGERHPYKVVTKDQSDEIMGELNQALQL